MERLGTLRIFSFKIKGEWLIPSQRKTELIVVTPLNLEQKYISVNGVRMAFVERTGSDESAPTGLFVHGLGCHSRDWDATLRLLDPSQSVICVDFRGHGQSEKTGPYSWSQLGSDLCAFIHSLNLESIIGVGHCLGAHPLLQAAAVLNKRFKALLLFEPAIFAPRAYVAAGQFRMFDSPEEHPYAKRRAAWDSPRQWFDTIRNRSPFDLWSEEVLWDHCQHGLERTEPGRYELRCPPLVEAETSLECASTDIHPMLSSVDVPVKVFRGKSARGIRHPLDTIHSLTWPKLAQSLRHGSDVQLDDLSHYIPMERPELVAEELMTSRQQV